MTSSTNTGTLFFTKKRDLDINALSADSSPDKDLDKMLVFSDGIQSASHSVRLAQLKYKKRKSEILCINKLAISQSTLNTYSPIPETYVYIPPLKTYHIFYTILYTSAVATTGMKPVIDIDANLVIRTGMLYTNYAGASSNVITPSGDSTAVKANYFLGVPNVALGTVTIGQAIISNTHASNTGESFVKITTEINASSVTFEAQQVSKICGRVFIQVMELE